jgi:hypothetical protein
MEGATHSEMPRLLLSCARHAVTLFWAREQLLLGQMLGNEDAARAIPRREPTAYRDGWLPE